MMIDTGTRFGSVDLSDDAKWTWAETAVSLWKAALQIAELASEGRITQAEALAIQSPLSEVAGDVWRHCMDSRAWNEGANEEVSEVYSDGSPIWTRSGTATSDTDVDRHLLGDLGLWVGGLQGELPLGIEVTVHQPPYFRNETLGEPPLSTDEN